MPDPKSGSAGTLVVPAAPRSALPADNAIPGEIEKQKLITPPQTHKPDPKKKGWIEIVLVDDEKSPVSGVKYRITLPSGAVAGGTLDEKGFARVEGFDPGTCQVTFPEWDKAAWSGA